MLKIKKFFICFVLTLLLLSSSVFATDAVTTAAPLMSITEPTQETATKPAVDSVYEDLYIYGTEYCSIDNIVYGNIFASTTKFVTNPRNNGGIISGNLYLISNEATIESEVTYSNNKDKNGNYVIDSINSKSIINGNVYILSDSFTLQAGSEIHGDLYVASNSVNIEQDAVVDGNIFITASDITLNGQVTGSAYITADKFTMNFFAYITRDLYLNAKSSTLAGIVYRNAFITSSNELSTMPDFRVNQNLSVDFTKNFTFSGEVNGDATINAKALTFKNDDNTKCIINGNLKYATDSEMQIPEGIVIGEVSTSKYVDKSVNKISFTSLVLKLFTILAYVLVIVIFSKLFAPKAMEKLPELNLANTLISLGIGFISLFAIVLLFIVLCLSGIGVSLAFFFVTGYLFLLGLALPLFINKIAEVLKFKLNGYLKLLVVTVVFYLIGLIPVFGSAVMFIALLIGIGQILLGLFKKKK